MHPTQEPPPRQHLNFLHNVINHIAFPLKNLVIPDFSQNPNSCMSNQPQTFFDIFLSLSPILTLPMHNEIRSG